MPCVSLTLYARIYGDISTIMFPEGTAANLVLKMHICSSLGELVPCFPRLFLLELSTINPLGGTVLQCRPML